MAKVGQVLAATDALKPNALTQQQLLQWLNELEGTIQLLVLHDHELRSYVLPEDADTQTVVSAPWDKLYWMYLSAMVDFANGEYSKYQNSMLLFQDAYGEYARWIIREKGYLGRAALLNVW